MLKCSSCPVLVDTQSRCRAVKREEKQKTTAREARKLGHFKTFAFQAERRVYVSNGLWDSIYTLTYILIHGDLVPFPNLHGLRHSFIVAFTFTP